MTIAARPRRGHPRPQRAGGAGAPASGGCTPTCGDVPVPLPDHGGRQRQHRRRTWSRRPASWPSSCRRCGPSTSTQKGRGRALKAGVARLGRADPGLHGRRPVDRPRRPVAPGRAADVGPLRPGHRQRGWRTARGSSAAPRREVISPGYNLLLRGSAGGPVHRRPVRLQGDPGGRGGRAAAAGARTRLVLRHRAAGARRALRAADPRGAGRLVRRPGQPGRRACAPRWTTCAASCGCGAPSPPDGCRWRPCASGSAGTPPGRRVLGQVWRFAVVGLASTALHLGLFAWLAAALPSAQTANLLALLVATVANTAANRRWTFGVRGRRRPRSPAPAGAHRLRAHLGDEQPGAAARRQRHREPGRGAADRRDRRRQPGRHGGALRR